MSDVQSNNTDSSKKNTSLLKSCAWLTLAILLVYPVFVLIAFRRSGTDGIWATVIAAALCWVGAIGALTMVKVFQGSPNAVLNGFLGSILFRTGVPFLGGLLLQQNVESLAAAGIFGYVMVYYLIVLTVESLLSLKMISSGQQAIKISSENHTSSKIIL